MFTSATGHRPTARSVLRNQFSGDSFPVVWLLTAGVDRFPNNDSSLVGLAMVHVAYILSENVRNMATVTRIGLSSWSSLLHVYRRTLTIVTPLFVSTIELILATTTFLIGRHTFVYSIGQCCHINRQLCDGIHTCSDLLLKICDGLLLTTCDLFLLGIIFVFFFLPLKLYSFVSNNLEIIVRAIRV